jgi:carbon-monoxide dehydrogenase medium subunit
MYSFNYVRASSLADAAKALGSGEEARALAGGQTILPTIKQRLAQPSTLVDLAGIAELKGIGFVRNGNLRIGAMTTHAEVAANADVRSAIPALAKLAGGIGDPAVRHVGTIGGSVANNDPAADYPAGVLGLGAIITTSKRNIPAHQFFTGLFSTALEPGELITHIEFPTASTVSGDKLEKAGYAKFEQRASRYALVGAFVAKTSGGVRVAITGAGANGVFRAAEIEKALAANWSADAAKAVKLAPAGMLSDLHGSAEYRAALCSVMASRAVAGA